MSLARQIVMLLDLATEPLSVRTLVAQITAIGGDVGAEAVHKRMHQMLPRAAKRKKSGADSGMAKPADAGALGSVSDAELAATVQAWMDSHGAWTSVRQVAAAIYQDTSTVAAALERLCDAGTVIWRYVSTLQRAKQYAPAQGRCLGDLQPTLPAAEAAHHVHALDTIVPAHDVQTDGAQLTNTDVGLCELGSRDRVHRMPPGPDRWRERSRTFSGIAEAMADQWGWLPCAERAAA